MKMRCRRLFPLIAAATLASFDLCAFQTILPPKSALDRKGLHHATIRGRFVSPAGDPIPGVRVQMNAGRPTALPLVDVVSGADGTFEIRDVSSSYTPDLRWYPPEEWLSGGMPLRAESGAEFDAGTVQLDPNTIVRIALEFPGGPPAAIAPPEGIPPTVRFQNKERFDERLIADETGGPDRLLREVTFSDGTFEVDVEVNKKTETFRAPYHLTLGRRDQLLTLRLMQDTVKPKADGELVGEIEIVQSILPATNAEKNFVAAGRVLASDGNPVAGAIVRVKGGAPTDFLPARWTATDSQGNFSLGYRSLVCLGPAVNFVDRGFWSRYQVGDHRDSCEARSRTRPGIVVASGSRMTFEVDGLPAGIAARAYWWEESLGWQPFSSLQPLILIDRFDGVAVKVEADGFLPLVETTRQQWADVAANRPRPVSIPKQFHFDTTATRELIVRAATRPLMPARLSTPSGSRIWRATSDGGPLL